MIMNCLQGPNSHLYPQGQPPCGICDLKLLFQVRFFDGSKLIKNKVGGLFSFLSWFNLMRFKITFSPPCYSFKVLEFADRLNTRVTGERVKICPPTKTLTSLQALRGLWSIHYHNLSKNLVKNCRVL